MSSLALTPLAAVVRGLAVAGSLGGALLAPAQAVTFNELGDAGQTRVTAQTTTAAAGALTDIFGSLSSSQDADLYVINITSPASFSATTLDSPSPFLDTQLFLLTLAGAPVYFNDDDAGGLAVQSTLGAGSAFRPVAAGLYILGVSISGYNPVNVNNQLLFAPGLPTATVGPAFGLQPALLGGFFDSTYAADSGAYDIRLTGATAATLTTSPTAVPEPTSAALLLAGGAFCAFYARSVSRGRQRANAA